MDGVQGWVRASLQRRLSLWLSIIIIGVAVLAGGFAFVSAFSEAHELQDDVLRQVGAMFDPEHLPAPPTSPESAPPVSDQEARVIVQVLPGPDGTVAAGTPAPRLAFPPDLVDGMQTAHAGKREYRVWVRTLDNGQRIAVAQETAVRDETARDSAIRTLMPFLILAPILLLAVADVLRKMFAPIKRLAHEVDQRDERQLHAIAPEAVPDEVRPFVVAIDRLLARVGQSMEAQQRFVADAAHELRTPLAAARLRLQTALEHGLSQGDVQAAINALHTLGLRTEKLLQLSRAESSAPFARQPVDLGQLATTVAQEFWQDDVAVDRLDLVLDYAGPGPIALGDFDALAIALRNLVENALHYAGSSAVELIVGPGSMLTVRDHGPGVDGARLQALQQRHVRDSAERAGYGLGLSIVATIAAKHGAGLTLTSPLPGESGGFEARLRLGAATAPAHASSPAAAPPFAPESPPR